MIALEPSLDAMRTRPRATREQRKELRASLTRFQRPDHALRAVRDCLPGDFVPGGVSCHIQSVHPDRFVVHVRIRSDEGESCDFALKVYSDDFGAQMWELSQSIAARCATGADGLCLPHRYLRDEHALVFPWVEGVRLSEIIDERKPWLLGRAARLAADIHRTQLATVPAITLEMVLCDTLDRCGRLRYRWPSTESAVRPLVSLLQKAGAELDPARPSVIHGDMAAGQFVWTGERLVLLDMDAAGRADPAYDVGHFMGQLERRCTLDSSLPPHSKRWLDCFREAYPAETLGVSWRNVSFYQGITLLRKMYTLSRRDPIAGPRAAVRLAERAKAAFESLGTPV